MDQKTAEAIYPETALEALDQFKAGDIVTVVELGGIGPGYEQAIWNGIFAVIEDRKDAEGVKHWVDGKKWAKPEGEKYLTKADADLMRIIKDDEYGLSGAQAGAIKTTAYQLLTYGWRAMLLKAPADRRIGITKNPPHYKKD